MDRCEKEAISSSFHPGEERTTGLEPWHAHKFGNHKEEEAAMPGRGASFFLDVREGKKPSGTQALKIQLIRGAVSSINRADTEQTALPGAPGGCGALSSLCPPSSSSPVCSSSGHKSSALSPAKATMKSLDLFVGLLPLP